MNSERKYYLAIDIGASSGRHILGWMEEGILHSTEIYRFENGYHKENGSLVWDIDALWHEVLTGIQHCRKLNQMPSSIAIDTWGVDYVLLDEKGEVIEPAYCYRDERTETIIKEVEEHISRDALYERTGIQFQPFNTIYQLYEDLKTGRLKQAKHFLMLPEYLSYRLTGVMKKEYTNASTTGLLNAVTKTWDDEIIKKLGLPECLFDALHMPCEAVGTFLESVKEQAGFDAEVILAPSHDTASAVCATPMEGSDLFLSSGTWSLIGIESDHPIICKEAQLANFTNEGGIDYRFRFLKNYMGMWLLQNVRKDLKKKYSYDEMMHMAEGCTDYSYLDVNDARFVSPDHMIDAIKVYLQMMDADLPYVLASIYHSLARSYQDALLELERVSGEKIEKIHIVGGGCQDAYLNALTAKYTGRIVTAGPVEATAIGNLLSQLLHDGTCRNLSEARLLVKKSFAIKEVGHEL